MRKYYCKDCRHKFEEHEAESKLVCAEDYYGVGSQFEDSTYVYWNACPECGSVELDEIYEWEEEEEEDEEDEE